MTYEYISVSCFRRKKKRVLTFGIRGWLVDGEEGQYVSG